jgi:hypothetical protein
MDLTHVCTCLHFAHVIKKIASCECFYAYEKFNYGVARYRLQRVLRRTFIQSHSAFTLNTASVNSSMAFATHPRLSLSTCRPGRATHGLLRHLMIASRKRSTVRT